MREINKIDVHLGDKHVGALAVTRHLTAFQYSDEWLESGYSISPLSLPLEKKLFMPRYEPFEGVFGVFADTLPDGWGRLIVDRYIRAKFKMDPDELDGFHRLTLVSDAGMGALSYRPSFEYPDMCLAEDHDRIAQQCAALLRGGEVEDPESLDTLFKHGGSSGGARPKVNTDLNGESWIIKFPSSMDNRNIGRQEYEYSLCAKACGIEMEETKLFPSKLCDGYFGTKRFDRKGIKPHQTRIHMVSAGGLLETSHRYPNLDYRQLMKLTMVLTGDMQEVRKMYDLMCFNVYAHNRDDHAKNFSYLYDDNENRWKLSPAYDLTYSNSQGGEHATTINGEGKSPKLGDILEVAKYAGIKEKQAKVRAMEIEETVNVMLKEYL